MRKILFVFSIMSLLFVEIFGFSNTDSSFSGGQRCYPLGDDYWYIVENSIRSYSFDDCYYTVNYSFFSVDNFSIYRNNSRWILSSGFINRSGSVEKNFVLEDGKVWVFKIVLYEPAKLLNFLRVNYVIKTTRSVFAHKHSINVVSIVDEKGDELLTFINGGMSTFGSHPLFLHYDNVTVDNLNIFLENGSVLNFASGVDISDRYSVFNEGVYYIVVGSQAYTLNSSDYNVFYNVSFVFPENYSMSIEVYKQADPIGVSFSEMNASYVYWDWNNDGGKTVFIDGNIVFKSDHTLFVYMENHNPLRYIIWWYDFTIGSSRYIGLGWHRIGIRIPLFSHPPLLTIYKDKSLPISLSYSFIKDSSIPISIAAFDIELK